MVSTLPCCSRISAPGSVCRKSMRWHYPGRREGSVSVYRGIAKALQVDIDDLVAKQS